MLTMEGIFMANIFFYTNTAGTTVAKWPGTSQNTCAQFAGEALLISVISEDNHVPRALFLDTSGSNVGRAGGGSRSCQFFKFS